MIGSYSVNDLKSIANNFADELARACEGKKTSLPFIKNPLPHGSLIQEDETFQAISIGGSHLETSLVKKENGQIHLLGHKNMKLPLLATKEILCEAIANEIDPSAKVLGLNFAYPIEPVMVNGVLDGKLINGSKEHELKGLIGLNVGEEVAKCVLEKKNQKIIVSVANDTICVALSGLNLANREQLVGGIVGTGMNFSVFIDANTIVNLEAACFNKFPQTETGKVIDSKSIVPGHAVFEKEVSGGYLYQHYNVARELKGEQFTPLTSTLDLAMLAINGGDGSDLAKLIIDRAASLLAAQMAGIYKFRNQPQLTYIIEGSLFWKGWEFKNIVAKRMNEMGIALDAFKIVHVDKSNIKGAAGLVI